MSDEEHAPRFFPREVIGVVCQYCRSVRTMRLLEARRLGSCCPRCAGPLEQVPLERVEPLVRDGFRTSRIET